MYPSDFMSWIYPNHNQKKKHFIPQIYVHLGLAQTNICSYRLLVVSTIRCYKLWCLIRNKKHVSNVYVQTYGTYTFIAPMLKTILHKWVQSSCVESITSWYPFIVLRFLNFLTKTCLCMFHWDVHVLVLRFCMTNGAWTRWGKRTIKHRVIPRQFTCIAV